VSERERRGELGKVSAENPAENMEGLEAGYRLSRQYLPMKERISYSSKTLPFECC
jgi:hypothetical protein